MPLLALPVDSAHDCRVARAVTQWWTLDTGNGDRQWRSVRVLAMENERRHDFLIVSSNTTYLHGRKQSSARSTAGNGCRFSAPGAVVVAARFQRVSIRGATNECHCSRDRDQSFERNYPESDRVRVGFRAEAGTAGAVLLAVVLQTASETGCLGEKSGRRFYGDVVWVVRASRVPPRFPKADLAPTDSESTNSPKPQTVYVYEVQRKARGTSGTGMAPPACQLTSGSSGPLG